MSCWWEGARAFRLQWPLWGCMRAVRRRRLESLWRAARSMRAVVDGRRAGQALGPHACVGCGGEACTHVVEGWRARRALQARAGYS